MVFFITFLRALASCLITNSHYTGIYPTDLIANGGLLGDILFFAVSGYCLYNIKDSFLKWYGKRLFRCYLPVILITAFYLIIGLYNFSEHSIICWFIYPTRYHFVASIVVLYIPFYIVIRTDALRKRLAAVMIAIAVSAIIVYLFIYDKSYYHIDTVREPMILFLYFESMIMGAGFRQNDAVYKNKLSAWLVILATVSVFAYFASKLLFSRYGFLSRWQILNWVTIFALLFCIFRVFCGIDEKLERLPKWIKKPVSYIAEITLEIYVVQYALIPIFRSVGHFPLNWILVTTAILFSASLLHLVCNFIQKLLRKPAVEKH